MNRLETISALTKGYDTIADIGSDHAYVCIEAVKKYGVKDFYRFTFSPISDLIKKASK